jgi:hypothetical protein
MSPSSTLQEQTMQASALRWIRPGAALGALLVLSACATQGGYDPRTGQYQQGTDWQCIGGTVAGGVAGAVVGSQFGGGTGQDVMTGVGAAGGALAGRELACRDGSLRY